MERKCVSKTLALSLSSIILFLSAFTVFKPTKAQAVSFLSADFGKTATLNDLGKKNYWENKNIFLSESDTGGVNIRFANAFVSHRYGTRNAVAIDGMYIKIANILSSENIKPSVGFRFTAALQDDIASGGGDYSLVIDTQNGDLLLYHNYRYGYYNILIDDNDILKYDNVTGKEVILHTVLNSDETVYNVTVYVGNEKVSAELQKSLIKSKCYSFNSWDSAYLCLAPGVKSGSNQSFSFDFIEYSNHKYADTAENTLNAAKSAIDAAPDAANDINNLALARSAINAFNNLLPWDKSELTEAQISKVINLKEDISELIAEDEKNLQKIYFSNTYMHGGPAYQNPLNGDTTSVYKTLNVDWANQMNVNTGENGVRFAFTNASDAVREGIRLPFNLNRGKIQFDNLEAKDGQEPKLTTLLSYDRQTSFAEEQKETNLSLVLDTKEGTLIARPSGQTVIAANDNLKLANIRGERFSYSFRLLSDNSLEVTLTIKGAEYKGIITTENFTKATLVTTDPDRIMVTVLAGDSQDGNTNDTSTYSFEITALGGAISGDDDYLVDSVVKAIDLIGDVTVKSFELIADAENRYNALSPEQKEQVTNYNTLVEAKQEYIKAATEYYGELNYLSVDQMYIFGNTTNQSVMNTANSWRNSSFALTDMYGRGVHFEFNKAVVAHRDSYKQPMALDGLFIQFDNFDSSDASKAKFSVMFASNPNNYGIEYKNNSLAFVLDPLSGTVTAYPKNEVIIKDDLLKLENLKGKKFSYYFDISTNNACTLTVTVGDKALTGELSSQGIEMATAVNLNSATVGFHPFTEGSSFSFDLIGIKATKVNPNDVIKLIDNIGFVTIDSGDAIKAAQELYDKLEKKEGIYNYSLLEESTKLYESLDFDGMISDTIALIDKIGEINASSKKAIDAANDAYFRLNDAQRKKVTNYSVLEDANYNFNKFMFDKMQPESYLNYPTPIVASINTDWQNNIEYHNLSNNALQIVWKDAIRDMRNGSVVKLPLDKMFIRIGNLTAEEGKTGSRLALIIGNVNDYNDGYRRSIAVVLDTVDGSITAWPGGYEVVSADFLKQSNIEGKEINFFFNKTEEGHFKLTAQVGFDTVTGVIHFAMFNRPGYSIDTEGVQVALSPWVDNDNGSKDGSKHTFQVDFLSIQSSGKFVYEDLADMMDRIDKLPEKLNNSDVDGVFELLNSYLSLERPIRGLIENYTKLSDALDQAYELSADDYKQWDISDAKDHLMENISHTGEDDLMVNTAAILLLISLCASFAAVYILKSKLSVDGGIEND